MTEILREPVRDATAWTGAQLQNDPSWRVAIGERERDAMLAGLKVLQAKGLWFHQMEAADFPLEESLKALVARIKHDVKDGRGFLLLDGFPIKGLTIDEIRLIYWGLALQLGTCVSQDGRAALVADVWDRGQKKTPLTRAYGSKRESKLHVDLSDVVGLLCVRQAKGGAPTTLASSMTVYNGFLKEHPDLVPMLYEGFHWDRFSEHAPWDQPMSTTRIPVFSYAKGQLSCRYNRSWISGAFARMEKQMSNAEQVLFDFFDQVAEENRLEIDLQPGQVYFASNYTVLHGRASYEEDTEDFGEKRHLLRVWLNMPGFRAFADEAVMRYGLTSHGNIGWTGAELLARKHLQPGNKRQFLVDA
jgi:hypothetical protein